MKIRWLSILSLFILLVTTAQGRDRLTIEASLDSEARTISGSIVFDIENRSVDLTDLRFLLYPNLHCADNDGCGIEVDSLIVARENLSANMSLDGTDLHVPLTDPVLAGRAVTARLWFTTHIPVGKPRVGYSEGRYTLAEWFPVLAPWHDNHWQKTAYRDFLEPGADLVDIELTLSYPDSLQLIAPGIAETQSVDGHASTRIELEAASGAPLFLGTGLLLDSTAVGSIALKLYYRESDSFILDTVRAAATKAMEYMSEYVLEYPFDELLIVIGGLSGGGGLEQPRMILASNPPRALRMGYYPSMIVHEVVHQWFYGIVKSSQAEAPWLDESVTEYFTLKIGDHRAQGEPDWFDAFGLTMYHQTYRRMGARPVMATDRVTRQADQFYNQSTYYGTVYSKGTLILQTLTALMGEEKERTFWQEYAATFRFGSPQAEDFIQLANKYLPTCDSADAATLLNHRQSTDLSVIALNALKVVAPAAEGEELSDEAVRWEVSIDYMARHPLGFPVDMRVEFLDGAVRDTVVYPVPGRNKLEYTASSPAIAAIIDPEFKYAIDDDFLNNSLTREQSRGAALRLFSGVTFLVESLFSSLWGW